MTQKYYYLPAGEFQLATTDEATAYLDKASTYIDSRFPRSYFGSYRAQAVAAVAEYMAYQDDKTLRDPKEQHV